MANVELTLDTNWEDILKQLPMMDANSPERPDNVRENGDPSIVVKIKDFQPTLGRIYLHKPKAMPTNAAVLDSDVWYIYDTVKNEACRLRLLLTPKLVSSGIRFLYKYDKNRTEEQRIAERDAIRSFNLPLRLWVGSSPTPEEDEQERKLRIMCSIIRIQFFRWKKAMGRESADMKSLASLDGMEKTIRYKIDDDGIVVEGRGPTLTLKTYSQGVNGKKPQPPEFLLQPEEWECTSKVYMIRDGKRVLLNQEQIHDLMPQWIARQLRNGTYPPTEGDPTKFLFDVEPIVHFAKARRAAGGGSVVRYVTQALIRRKRAAGEAEFEFDVGGDDEDDGEWGNQLAKKNGGGSNTISRPSASGGGGWAMMGQAIQEVEKANTVKSAEPQSDPSKGEGEEEDDEEEDSEEEDEEDSSSPPPVSIPVQAPVVVTKPGIVAPPAEPTPAPVSAPAPRSRRATQKK